MAANWTAAGAMVVAGALLAIPPSAPAPGGGRTPSHLAANAFAQAEPKPERPRTRIRVTPLYPYRRESLPYPPPYDIEYPGPGFVRQCTSWLAPEHRPSGTVIVPHSRCWWERR
jgi:hypothetical protein